MGSVACGSSQNRTSRNTHIPHGSRVAGNTPRSQLGKMTPMSARWTAIIYHIHLLITYYHILYIFIYSFIHISSYIYAYIHYRATVHGSHLVPCVSELKVKRYKQDSKTGHKPILQHLQRLLVGSSYVKRCCTQSACKRLQEGCLVPPFPGGAKRVADRTSRSAVARPAFFLGGQHVRISPRSVFQRMIRT